MTTHPFSKEAPDALSEDFFEAVGLTRQVMPEGALSASDRHLWITVTDNAVEVHSTPSLKVLLAAQALHYDDVKSFPYEGSLLVVAAGRPYAADPMHCIVFPHEDHFQVYAMVTDRYGNTRRVEFTRIPKTQ